MSPFDTFLKNIETEILNPLITLIALAAFIVFVWGVVGFIQGADNEVARGTGQKHILWGIIGLTIIFAATVIVKFLGSVVGV